MLRERNQSFKILFITLDSLLSFLAFVCAFVMHFYIISPDKREHVIAETGGFLIPAEVFSESFFIFGTYAYLGVLIVFLQMIVFIATDLYHPRRGLNQLAEFIHISRGVIYTLLILLALLFVYRGVSYSRLVILYTGVFSILFHTAGHYYLRRILGRLRQKGFNTRNVLVLGTGKAAQRFLETLEKHSIYGYSIIGILGAKKDVPQKYRSLILGSLKEYESKARQLNPDLIVCAVPSDSGMLTGVVNFCDQEGIDCRIIPDMLDMVTHSARIEDMDGIPVFTIRDIPLKNGYNAFIKRMFDICFSLVILTLFSPLFLIITVIIKLGSPGPVFFRQERIGLDRKSFYVWKFRSMVVQKSADSDTIWGTRNDARVTGIGKFLRKTSLDEVPQFFNVLTGDMSVVGPRPERPHFVREFKKQYTHYMRRHSVKAGITGWAQIQGLRGDTSIEKRVKADIYYIENWSLWLDILIILRTLPSLISNPGD